MLANYIRQIMPYIDTANRPAVQAIVDDSSLDDVQMVARLIDLAEPKTDVPSWAASFQRCAD